MTEPLVACVCLVRGRAAMVRRAVRSYNAQTYSNRMMLLWVTEDESCSTAEILKVQDIDYRQRIFAVVNRDRGLSIGRLRNEAAAWLFDGPTPHPEIIAHWDSDDVSHPRRLEEQVAHLQQSKAQAVGYNQMLFWDERWGMRPSGQSVQVRGVDLPIQKPEPKNEAWLYARPNPRRCTGTSLLYWSGVWKQSPFPDKPRQDLKDARTGEGVEDTAEDTEWIYNLGLNAVSAMADEPRMIASVHGANTYADHYGRLLGGSPEFVRAPEFDAYCRRVMAL